MKLTRSVLCVAAMAISLTALAKDNKLSAEEIVPKHLQALGKSTDPADVPRIFRGQVEFSETIGRNVRITGTSLMVSQGNKVKCAFQFGAPQYPGEQFVFDGNKGMVGMIDATSRSNLGTFLYLQEEILREGLFGGTLSTAWPLLDVVESGAKLKYQGLHKVDGRDLHDLLYTPKKRAGNGELVIHLFLEPESFRHVMTTYTVTLHLSEGSIREGTDEVRQVLEERFEDFRPSNGLIVPAHWIVRYHVTPQNKAQEFQWDTKFETMQAPLQ